MKVRVHSQVTTVCLPVTQTRHTDDEKNERVIDNAILLDFVRSDHARSTLQYKLTPRIDRRGASHHHNVNV